MERLNNKLPFLGSLFWVQFSFERRRIVDTLTDFKRKMKPKEAVKSGNLLLNRSYMNYCVS
jgi:hypothetical protein